MGLPSILIISICMIVILVALLQKNGNFLDIREVFRNHHAILLKNPLQFTAIMVCPAIIATNVAINQPLTENIVNNLNVVLSILISMFFAVLSILVSFNYKKADSDQPLTPQQKNYNYLLKQTYNTVIYESTLCVILMVISFITLFIDDFSSSAPLTIASIIVYYLSLIIVLNILMVIKRIKVLFEHRD